MIRGDDSSSLRQEAYEVSYKCPIDSDANDSSYKFANKKTAKTSAESSEEDNATAKSNSTIKKTTKEKKARTA